MKNPAANRSTRFTKADRANPTTQSARKRASLRIRVPILEQGGPQTSSTTASIPTPPAAQIAPPVPAAEPRLRIVNGEFVSASMSVATPIEHGVVTDRVQRLFAYDRSAEIICPECSLPDKPYFHLPFPRLTRQEAQGFLGYTENTLFTKHSRGEMPQAVSGPPLEFSTCHLAAFKYDGVILKTPFYVRSAHLAALPAAREARGRKRAEKSAKLSAHMRRRHAAARKAATRRSGATHPSSTRRAIKAGGAR